MKRVKASRTETGLRLSFYTQLPGASVDFETFRRLVEVRMKMLKDHERAAECRDLADMQDDVLSHFFCRVVCSQVPWAAAWFVNAESALFRLRASRSLADAKAFLMNDILPRMSNGETRDGCLVLGVGSMYNPDAEAVMGFSDVAVHFTKLIDLVGRRAVVPERGFLRVDENCTRSLLGNEFRRYLGLQMDRLVQRMQLEPDERMQRLCIDLLTTPQRKELVGDFSLDDAEKHFPLCMQAILERLRKNRHLKYSDRQALCLFLKDCGMPLEDNIAFFRSSFRADRDVFNKEYLYSIRHNYGLEGKRANYSCFNCAKMANTTNERRESSCPFVGDQEYVRTHAARMEVEIEDVGTYNTRCTRMLEALTHRVQDRPVTMPTRYYFKYRERDSDANK